MRLSGASSTTLARVAATHKLSAAVHPRPFSTRAAAAVRSAAQPGLASSEAEALDLPPPPPPLKPVPIIHTTAYLQQTQQLVVPQLPSVSDDGQAPQEVQYDGSNAIVWALKKVDDQLNLVEQQPSDLHQAIYDFSNGPVGQATSKGVQVAAKLTMTATIEAAKVAAPVGKWALQQGFKAAVGLVGAAIQQEHKQQKQQQQQQQNKTKKQQQGSGKGKRQ